MLSSYDYQPLSPSSMSSSCEIESMDEIPASTILSMNDDMTISTRLNTTTLENTRNHRLKVSSDHLSVHKTSLLFVCLTQKKRKRNFESDTVSLRSLDDFPVDDFHRKNRLSLSRLSMVSDLLSPMCDRVIHMLQASKQSSSIQLLNNTHATLERKTSSPSSSAQQQSPSAIKKFRAAWSETCHGEKLKQTMTATEIERQNVIYELLSEEQQMIENLGLAQRVRPSVLFEMCLMQCE